jgi:ketosteroid isomerase-like protein
MNSRFPTTRCSLRALAPMLALGLAGCFLQGTLTAESVRLARTTSNTAIAARDTATLRSLLAPSYHLVTSRNVHNSGRDEAVRQWAQQFATLRDVSYVRTTKSVRVYTPWEMAHEDGEWVGRWTEADGPVEIRGAYTAKWRRTGGLWLLEAEVFTPLSCSGSAYCTRQP